MTTKEEATAQALERLGADEVAKRAQGTELYLTGQAAFLAWNKARNDKITAFVATLNDDPDIAPLKYAHDAAEAAWLDFDGGYGDVRTTYDETLLTCALTGVTVFDTDDTLYDNVSETEVLRAALPLPPRESDLPDPEDAAAPAELTEAAA